MTHRQFLETAGARLEYLLLRSEGSTGPTLVLLHGGLGSLEPWKDFPVQLAEACGSPVLIYSPQGYGRSSPVTLPRPLDYLSVTGPDELGCVRDGLALEQVVLLGHSDGASIALAYAAHQDPRAAAWWCWRRTLMLRQSCIEECGGLQAEPAPSRRRWVLR